MSYKKLIFLSLGIAGCASQLYTPSAENVSPGTTLASLREGRALYVQYCGSCHTLKLPQEYSAEVWKANLDEMQQRARISDDQKLLILSYLKAGKAASP